jgi:hypothetical protein
LNHLAEEESGLFNAIFRAVAFCTEPPAYVAGATTIGYHPKDFRYTARFKTIKPSLCHENPPVFTQRTFQKEICNAIFEIHLVKSRSTHFFNQENTRNFTISAFQQIRDREWLEPGSCC